VSIPTNQELRSAKSERFDPLRELFVAQSARPLQAGEVNLRALSPFQRALLIIDGTVTKFIETYTLEPVDVVRLRHAVDHLPADHPWLDAPRGAAVIARDVLLQGRYSRALFAYGASLIAVDRLPPALQKALEADGSAIGRTLQESRMESCRELLWYHRETADRLPESVRPLVDGELISRTYRIISGGRPIMVINEKFPSGGDLLPSHH